MLHSMNMLKVTCILESILDSQNYLMSKLHCTFSIPKLVMQMKKAPHLLNYNQRTFLFPSFSSSSFYSIHYSFLFLLSYQNTFSLFFQNLLYFPFFLLKVSSSRINNYLHELSKQNVNDKNLQLVHQLSSF